MARGRSMATPFRGKVFCCTAVDAELRGEIAANVTAMGGIHKIDLMSDVTHLIVGDRYTPKYEFAVKNRPDIVFLRQSAVPELFQQWSSGSDHNFEMELDKRKLGIFEDFYVCFTNIASQQEREDLINLVNQNGGNAQADLNKNMTHLVTSLDSGKKCQYAKKWNITLVRPEWIVMSIQRAAALSEQYFSFDVPREKVGEGAVADWAALDRKKPAEHTNSDGGNLGLKLVNKSRLDLDNVWNSIIVDKSKTATRAISEDNEHVWQQKFRESKVTPLDYSDELNRKLQDSTGMFQDLSFHVVGFDADQKKTLHNVITSHEGIISSVSTGVDYLVVNSNLDPSLSPQPAENLVTEWMIERSLHKKTLTRDQWSNYVFHRKIPGFKNINISISGFSGVELLHLERLIAMVGANYQPVFIESRDILISSAKSKKFAYALAWNVPIVNEKWLWDSALEGKVLPLDSDKYVLDGKEHEGRVLKAKHMNISTRFPSANDSIFESSVNEDSKKENKMIAGESFTLSDVDPLKKKRSAIYDRSDSESLGPLSPPADHAQKRRLVGRATTSNVSGDSRKSSTSTTTGPSLTGQRGQKFQSSQVSYIDTENRYERNKLLEALGERNDNDDVPHDEEEMTPAVDLVTTEREIVSAGSNGRDKSRRRIR